MLAPPPLSDRDLIWFEHFSMLNGNINSTDLNCGPGKITQSDSYVTFDFGVTGGGEAISEQVRFAVTESRPVNGLGIRVQLRGWKEISYIAIGYTEDGVYQHVKASHPRQKHWFDLCIGFQDLAWAWRNNWTNPESRLIRDVRFYIKGVPSADAGCDISDIWIWHEELNSQSIFGKEQKISESIVNNFIDYQKAYFPDYAPLASDFMAKGFCPLSGNTSLEWSVKDALPAQLNKNGTWQYSWHSQHPAIMLMLLANDTGELGPVFAARELIANWLTNSFDTPDPNIKYTWYDHGVAERVLAMIMLYAYGQKYSFDIRFMMRLRDAIYRHAQLLASEVFYVCHQSIRYHNHAWFQDLALLAVASAFSQWRGSSLWTDTALCRIEDQFAQLIIYEGDFAVFAENSFGYHLGIEKLVASIGYFASQSGRTTEIPELAEALSRFSQLMLYPDKARGVAQGDTFRKSNPVSREEVILPESWNARTVYLPEAGYTVIKGGTKELPWLFTMFATNKNSTHKHQDDLSFFFWMDGIEWLIDPSFYSHEYADELPTYLRSAEAHNMLCVKDVPYDYRPLPGRTSLSITHALSKSEVIIKGVNRAYEGFEVFRELDYSVQNGGPVIQCLDYFINTTDQEQAQNVEGVLTFHIGDGVEILQQNSPEEGWVYKLSHPASKKILVLSIQPSNGIGSVHVEPSVSGLGFLEQIATQAIRITLPRSVECQWSLHVK